MAQGLIDQVRRASATLQAKEAARTAAEPGTAVTHSPGSSAAGACPANYEAGEKAESSIPIEPLVDSRSFTDYQEDYLYGFQVDSADASRFAAALTSLALKSGMFDPYAPKTWFCCLPIASYF